MKKCQENWFAGAVGRSMNPDKAYNLTCVDVMNDYGEAIFGVPWHVCVGGVNGAKDLYKANPKYWTWVANRQDPNWLPLRGDVIVYGGGPGAEYGHTFVVESATKTTVTGIEQNGTGQSLVPAARVTRNYNAAGPVSGWLRPRPEMMIGDPKPVTVGTGGVKLLTVTANPAVVRTSPRVEPGNVAPAYRYGIAKGSKVAAVGYVSGQDPYPNDGVKDDAWIKTVSGYYIWANGLGNSLAGLPAL